MTPLEREQRGILALLKGRGLASRDPYRERISNSPRLEILREIAVRWRMYQVEAQCRYTSRLLKRQQRFEQVVGQHFISNATSPFLETFTLDFLRALGADADVLVRELASSELAILIAHEGKQEAVEIHWDRNPDLVFSALEIHGPVPLPSAGEHFILRVGSEIRGLVECVRESATAAPQ